MMSEHVGVGFLFSMIMINLSMSAGNSSPKKGLSSPETDYRLQQLHPSKEFVSMNLRIVSKDPTFVGSSINPTNLVPQMPQVQGKAEIVGGEMIEKRSLPLEA